MSVLRIKIGRPRQPRRERRPRTYLRADARRAQILDAAKHLFARRGYHAVNIADLCKEADIARGTLYQYFDNKRDVMLALMRDLSARVGQVLDGRPKVGAIPGAADAPTPMVVAFCKKRLRELLDAVFVDAPTLRLILREARGLDGALDDAILDIDKKVLRALESDLRAAQEQRLLRKGNVKLIARYILGGVEKMVMMALASEESIDLGAIVDVAVDLELFGILATKEGSR